MQVIGNGVLGLVSEDRMIQPDHLLTGPQSEKTIEDDSIYWNLENAENWLPMDNFQCTSDYYNQEVDYGTLHVNTAQILEKDAKYESVDRMLQSVDDEGDLHFTCNLPSFRSDYLLDSVYQDTSNGLSIELKRSYSEGQTEFICREDNASEMSNSPTAANPFVEHTSDQSSLFLDNMDDQELLDAFRSIFGQDTRVMDKHWLKCRILFGLQNLGKIYNVSGNVESELLSSENEDNAIPIPRSNLCQRVYTSSTDTHYRKLLMVSRDIGRGGHSKKNSQRTTNEVARIGPGHGLSHSSVGGTALCKPTRRFTKEMAELKSSGQNEESHVQRGRPRKTILHNIAVQSESEWLDDLSDSAAEIRIKKSERRRKHKWTLPEVVKLIDGVSLYGVGNWREIKRELFPTSDFRTSVNLKDKWRNLLRASVAQQRSRNKESVHKFCIPKSVLQRVRELSAIHTHPREQKSRLTSTAASSIISGAANPSINCRVGAL